MARLREPIFAVWLALLVPQSLEAEAAVPRARGAEGLLGAFSLSRSSAPIHVRSDSAEFSYRELVLTYTGNVVVSQGDLKLRSNVLTIELEEIRDAASDVRSAGQVRKVVAEGSVVIEKGDQSARGEEAVFSQEERTVVLSKDAVLVDGPNEIRGERVVVYLDEDRSVVEGGTQRVQAILYPQSAEEDRPEVTAGPRPGAETP